MKTKVFIDGSSGTTGLKIESRLSAREDIELLKISEELRKDNAAKKEIMNKAKIVFLCLPDDAAREAVTLVENSDTVIIDTSTAHRTNDNWTYGFPELEGQREKIKASHRIANPGCHASGFVSLVAPLVKAGIIKKDAYLNCFSLTGYSGGGKKMIAEYEGAPGELFKAPRTYGIAQAHKHLPEMAKICGLDEAPVFCPIVAPYFCGMETVVQLNKTDIAAIKEVYKKAYPGGLVRFKENADENGFLSANAYALRDDMEISVFGNNDRCILVSRFDNLGKGASGAAIQNMNIVMGVPEATGLSTEE